MEISDSSFYFCTDHLIGLKNLLCVYKLSIINQHHLLCTSARICSHTFKSVLSWKFEEDRIKVNVTVHFDFFCSLKERV